MPNDAALLSPEETTTLLADLEAGFALPSNWYTDSLIFKREREQILRRGWHFAAHTGQLAKPGDQAVCEIAGVPVVLVVDRAGEIGGFVNICRHRAHTVVQEDGNRKTLQCLYHGWTYNLDGCLRRAPRAENESAFDKNQFGLTRVQTAVWGPTVWVNVDLEAPSFSTWIEGLPEEIAGNGLDVTEQVFALERSWEIRANWKVFLDNAIECYHCPTCHPTLAQVLEMDPEKQDISVGGRYWSSQRIPLRKSAVGTNVAAPTGSKDGESDNYFFHWIFPATYFQYAGSGFDIGTIDARGVDTIVFRHLSFLPADMAPEDIADRDRRLDLDPTVPEDVAICHRVQHAHESGMASTGRLLPRSEWLLQHYQRVLIEDLTSH